MKTLDKILISASGIVGTTSIGYGIFNQDSENCIKYGALSILAGSVYYAISKLDKKEQKNE